MSVKKELDIVQAVKIFFEGPKEVRIPHTQHNGTMAGVFDDPAKLIASVLSDVCKSKSGVSIGRSSASIPANAL
jgi:hypothetical protein